MFRLSLLVISLHTIPDIIGDRHLENSPLLASFHFFFSLLTSLLNTESGSRSPPCDFFVCAFHVPVAASRDILLSPSHRVA